MVGKLILAFQLIVGKLTLEFQPTNVEVGATVGSDTPPPLPEVGVPGTGQGSEPLVVVFQVDGVDQERVIPGSLRPDVTSVVGESGQVLHVLFIACEKDVTVSWVVGIGVPELVVFHEPPVVVALVAELRVLLPGAGRVQGRLIEDEADCVSFQVPLGVGVKPPVGVFQGPPVASTEDDNADQVEFQETVVVGLESSGLVFEGVWLAGSPDDDQGNRVLFQEPDVIGPGVPVVVIEVEFEATWPEASSEDTADRVWFQEPGVGVPVVVVQVKPEGVLPDEDRTGPVVTFLDPVATDCDSMDVEAEVSLPVASPRDDDAKSVSFKEPVGVNVGPSVVAIDVEPDGPPGPGLSNPDCVSETLRLPV
ncbi:hypothetical protein CEP54_004007 [Fusarium duplospermum]|uniref:Uncharacterized protein n=1 Tax=Fusarium duplospermum TaxID=1325734 RepID=A0A428QKT3_9HYPO|nr:hypothetical protein CEP54_004007 [Fusarium duplospermum]